MSRQVRLWIASAALVGIVLSGATAANAIDRQGDESGAVEPALAGAVTGRLLIDVDGSGPAAPTLALTGEVQLWAEPVQATDEPAYYAQVLPGDPGVFELIGVPAGEYRVSFESTRLLIPRAVREWHPNAATRAESFPITLVDGTPFAFGDVVVGNLDRDVDRVAGPDRFATAAAVARELYPPPGSTNRVVVVNGTNFPDALSAGALAHQLQAPLLMVTTNSIPDATFEYIAELDPDFITVVGGTGVVSSAVREAMAAVPSGGALVTPIAGADRYATSRAVINAMENLGVAPEFLVLATGRGFADALAAAPAAARYGGAVLLVDGSAGVLDAPTRNLISSLGVDVDIAGGTGVVSAGIEAELRGMDQFGVRFAGTDRFDTAAQIATGFAPVSDWAMVANGLGFADALAVGPWAAAVEAPLILSRSTCLPSSVAQALREGFANKVRLIGGTGVLAPGMSALPSC